MNKRYCAFIDVLGYGDLVKDQSIPYDQKVRILNSIYVSIASHISFIVNTLNKYNTDKIYIRSFSDSIYLDCDIIEHLIGALNDFYNYTFGFYSNFSAQEERTPLLRCGVVHDWVVHFRDIAAITNNTKEENPVGYGVARAYWTSEKTNLSGMRIILSPEVIQPLIQAGIKDGLILAYITEYGVRIPIYIKQISQDEKGNVIDLYELIWTYHINGPQYNYIDELIKLNPTFKPAHKRHLIATAELLKLGLRLTFKDIPGNKEVYDSEMLKLEKLIIEAKI